MPASKDPATAKSSFFARRGALLLFTAAICILPFLRASAQITNESPPPGYPPSGCDYDQRGNYYCWGNRNTPTTTVSTDRYAAIAVSNTTLRSGTSQGQTSQSTAEQLALNSCRTAASDCKAAMWGVNSCVALAVSLPEKTWGASWDTNRAQAGASAVTICRQHGGKSCTVQASPCASDDPFRAALSPLDPIVGCYRWFNGADVLIREDHTLTGGPFNGTWQMANLAQGIYALTWPQPTRSTVKLSSDQRSLGGGNQYGGTDTVTRLSGASGVVGTWRWVDVVTSTVTVNADGTFSAVSSNAKWHGNWKSVETSPGTYIFTASDLPTDKVKLAANGSRLSGADQYGITIAGTRTSSCSIR